MLIRTATVVAVLILVVAPAAAITVHVDYDTEVDFDSYKTFAWWPSPETSLEESSPLMHSRIKNAIEYQLTRGGNREVKENPDVWVTYHTDPRDEVRFNTTTWGYGYGTGWNYDPHWGAGMGSSTTTATTYTRGTLIIDIWDAKEEKAIFRGSAEAIVKEKPENAAKQIDKAIAKIAQKFAKMRAKQMKQEAKAEANN
jgi:hypothetical protein